MLWQNRKGLSPFLRGRCFMDDTRDEHSIYIGAKPFMNYVTGVMMQFSAKNASDVTIKARGKFISRAVDVAQVASRRFLETGICVSDIRINSEEFLSEEGRQVRVSTIEIVLSKKK